MIALYFLAKNENVQTPQCVCRLSMTTAIDYQCHINNAAINNLEFKISISAFKPTSKVRRSSHSNPPHIFSYIIIIWIYYMNLHHYLVLSYILHLTV